MKNISAVSIVSIFLAMSAHGAAFKLDVTKKIFPNGLTVLVQENHTAPIISYQTWFKIGSRHEVPGKTGLAHLFEHLMFKGTPRYSSKDFERSLENNGITHNAFTTQDYTVYFEDIPSDKLELVMDIESDRLAHLILNKDVFESERKVVQEERLLRVEQSIEGIMGEKLWGASFQKHPYKNPVIGWPQDLENLTLEDALAFFKNNYNISRAVISVSGDVSAAKVFSLIEKFYSGFQKADYQEKPALPESPLKKEFKIEVARSDAKTERILLGYRIGKAGEADSFVMDLISAILSQGKTSRLYRKLVFENQIATDVEGFASTPQDPGVYELSVGLNPGVTSAKILPVIDAEIERIKHVPVKPFELQRAKMKMVRGVLSSMKTCHGRAHNLALNEIITGSYQNLFDDLDQYEKVTAADVMKVASERLKVSNRVRVELKPK